MRFRIRTLLLIFAGVAIVLTLGQLLINNVVLPVPPGRVAQLKIGMSIDEVRELLGEPDTIKDHYWSYGKEWQIGWVTIHYDENG